MSASTSAAPVAPPASELFFNVSEADIDLLFAEEYGCNSDFRAWFLSKLGGALRPVKPPLYIGRSISNHHGESDLLIIEESDGDTKTAVLIENKISATPTSAQSERYPIRGSFGISEGNWDSFITVLIAPDRYLSKSMMKFDHRVAYEELVEVVRRLGGSRAVFKCSLLSATIAKAKKPWAPNPLPELTAWFVKAREFAITEFPDLPLPIEGKGRSPTSKWMNFYLQEFPMSLVGIEIKPHNGHVDLRLKGADLGKLRRTFFGRLPPGADTVGVKSGKSCAIRLTRPKADVSSPFETQISLMRPILNAPILCCDLLGKRGVRS
jgi:hypothetical protein